MMHIATETIGPIWEKYFRQVGEGETIILTRKDVPIAEIHPVNAEGKQLRPRGLAAGEFVVPDDLDAPLPDDIVKAFTIE